MALTVKVNTTCYFKWLRQDWIDFRLSRGKHLHLFLISAFFYLYICQVVPLETWVGDRLGLRTRCCHGSGKVEILRKKFSILQILYRFTPTWINWKHKFFFNSRDGSFGDESGVWKQHLSRQALFGNMQAAVSKL